MKTELIIMLVIAAVVLITLVVYTAGQLRERKKAIDGALNDLALLATVTNLDEFRRAKAMANHPAGKGRVLPDNAS